ncbi:ABC transporter ATP-binding protein [Mycoplasma buteonis]|uniref:ABC transporter ATP-binding protein n=1 Tax=Mycoplasma buteonis TaxID=171280 RepID=UPI00055EB752|nr:ABC transporter ATP-binding protein [Mycoplasma buteonis]
MNDILKNNSEIAIEIQNLSKSFKENKALDNLSFKVRKGELFGFLGLNGAGKSTTLNIILGLLSKDSGLITINGLNAEENIKQIRKSIGIVFQESILDPTLSVKDNLMIRATMYTDFFKVQKVTVKEVVENIIKEFQLEEIAKRPYGKLSGGQKRRVDIARALVHRPEILFLDEPTTGLDPSSRKLVWEILFKIQKERKLTILLTTHYMEEANNCQYAIIINKGKKLVEGTPSQLKQVYSTTTIKIFDTFNLKLEAILKKNNINFNYEQNCYVLKFSEYSLAKNFVFKNQDLIKDYELLKGTMDEVFLNVTHPEKLNQLGEKSV